MSAVPEVTQQEDEEEATEHQNQQTVTSSTTPEITQKEDAPESANPPTPLNTSTQPPNAQNQQKVSSTTEITEEDAIAKPTSPPNPPSNQDQDKQSSVPEITPPPEEAAGTLTNPPKLDNSAQPTKPQNQETLSSVPDITPEEEKATTVPHQLDDSSAQPTKETTDPTHKKSDENETPKKEDSTISTDPKSETTKQNDAPTKEDSTTSTDPISETSKQNEAPKQDSVNITRRTDKTTDPFRKKDSICFPRLGFHKSKEKKSQSDKKSDELPKSTDPKKQVAVQAGATASGKGELSKSTDPQKPVTVQDSATIAGKDKDEHPKSSEPQKPAIVQDSATTSGKDEQSKSTDPQKPAAVQDSATTSGKGKDEHSMPAVDQGSVTTDSKDELSKSIEADINYIEEESNRLDKYKGQVISQVNEAKSMFDDLKKNNNQGTEREFRDLKKAVTKLKLQIPSKHKADTEEKDPHKSQQAIKSSKIITEAVMKEMPRLYKSSLFESSAEVKDFEALFHGLSVELKLCLLCFSVFPEKAIIKKRLMVYWWIAEGLAPPVPRDDDTRNQLKNGKTAEEFADEYFQKLTKMGFIEPVNKKRSLYVGCYTLHPFVRLALIMIAEKAKFFNFDEEGNPTERSSGTFQACLMGRGLLDYQDLQKGHVQVEDLEKLHAVFNVNEPILDFKPEWFLKMKNVNVLYLGRWRVSATDHIEVEESKFLDGLLAMDHLKFFSLQGVSRIMELPESISKLSNMIILDLRACHSLESIPEGIRSLKNLTYLDISECYLLEHMPKGLGLLSNLHVLKGFVVGKDPGRHTCTLDDLAKLEKLVKLCIYTGLGEFPTDKHLNALKNFKALKKLTMAWGGGALHTKSNQTIERPKPDDGGQRKKETIRAERKKGPPTKQTLRKSFVRLGTFKHGSPTATGPLQLEKLEKLDLKSYPKTDTPSWLMPSSLKSLKKLYIRGGKFSDLGQYQYLDQKGTTEPAKSRWKVEILRLKYLSELQMDWRELQDLFPNLIYLEKVNCPKLTFFPSDGYGVWINKEKYKEKLKQMQVRS